METCPERLFEPRGIIEIRRITEEAIELRLNGFVKFKLRFYLILFYLNIYTDRVKLLRIVSLSFFFYD